MDYYGDDSEPAPSTDFAYPDSVDLDSYGITPYPVDESRQPFNNIRTRSGSTSSFGHSIDKVIGNRNNEHYYSPMDKKDEYVQVHKYLKSHKRDPSYDDDTGLSRYSMSRYGDEAYLSRDFPVSMSRKSYSNFLEDERGSPYLMDRVANTYPLQQPYDEGNSLYGEDDLSEVDDFINSLSYDDLKQLYSYLTGEELNSYNPGW